jgi:hypothetical protein
MTLPTLLVAGGSGRDREAAIAADIASASRAEAGLRCAIILEGLPSGDILLVQSDLFDIHRIAPGCLCCTGNLVLRVTLNRLLRRPPGRLYIGLATGGHLDQLRSWLLLPPYDQLLELLPALRT